LNARGFLKKRYFPQIHAKSSFKANSRRQQAEVFHSYNSQSVLMSADAGTRYRPFINPDLNSRLTLESHNVICRRRCKSVVHLDIFIIIKSVFITYPKTTRLLSLICLTFYLIVLSRPLLPYFEFLVNKDFIAAVLCINRENPQVECGGKCHLTKQLQKAGKEDTEQQKPVNKTGKTEQLPLAMIESTFSGQVHFSRSFASSQNLKTVIPDYTIAPPTPPPRLIRS
jgi:hypothetical protein